MQGYYLRNGAPEGPLPMEEIFQKARCGEIPPQTLVWNETMDGWRALHEVYPQIFPRGVATYASFWERLAAYCIDGVVINIIASLLGGPLFALGAFLELGAEISLVAAYLLSFLGGMLYYACMESSRFQGTLGKMALGLRVTGLNGERITFGRALLRFASKIISGFILMIGYLMMLWSRQGQCLHDQLAGTLVVKKSGR